MAKPETPDEKRRLRRNASQRAWREKHPDAVRAYRRAYLERKANPPPPPRPPFVHLMTPDAVARSIPAIAEIKARRRAKAPEEV